MKEKFVKDSELNLSNISSKINELRNTAEHENIGGMKSGKSGNAKRS